MTLRRTGIRRSGGPRRHTRLAPRSRKRESEQRQRREAMLARFGSEPACAAQIVGVCAGWADDAHEPGMRSRGADPTNPDQAMPVCRGCHTAIHDNPAWATENGLLWPSGGGA